MKSPGSGKALRQAVVACALGLLACLGALLPARADGTVRGFYFYSPDCGHCRAVAETILPDVQARFGARLELRMFDIRATPNYELLRALEARYGLVKVDLPEVFIGPDALVGEEAIRTGLVALVEKHLAAGGVDYPSQDLPAAPPSAPATATPAADLPLVHLAYFFQRGCRECDRVQYDLNLLQSRYANLRVRAIDIGEGDAPALYEALARQAGLPGEKRLVTPAVFVGSEALVGADLTLPRLEVLVGRYAQTGAAPAWEGLSTEAAKQDILARFRRFGLLTVVGAGLVDGLNPCAFATIVFLVSYLAFVGRSRREIVVVGTAFTLGVFATYLLVGLGALRFVQTLSGIELVGRALYGLMAALCLVFAGVSLHDAWQARRGQPQAMRLRLPRQLQKWVHRVIREQSSRPTLVAAAAFTGLAVSLLELACTGQVYLPTIVYVVSVGQFRAHAVSYLVLYNLAFVLPLVAVFVVVALGTSSERLASLVQKHTGSVKLLTAAVFAILGTWLLGSVL